MACACGIASVRTLRAFCVIALIVFLLLPPGFNLIGIHFIYGLVCHVVSVDVQKACGKPLL